MTTMRSCTSSPLARLVSVAFTGLKIADALSAMVMEKVFRLVLTTAGRPLTVIPTCSGGSRV
jgi:hypothetical protein